MTVAFSVFCFGFGFVAQHLAPVLRASGQGVAGTRRLAVDALAGDGTPLYGYESGRGLSPAGLRVLGSATHVLIAIPPDATGDPVIRDYGNFLQQNKGLRWVGLLSTTGVYGDTGGAWVDETAPLLATQPRDTARILAEQQLMAWGRGAGVATPIFRLSGIYGSPGSGRSPLDRARAGAALIDKPGHVFNRIHVADIVRVLCASMTQPRSEVYNVTDSEPDSSLNVMRAAYQALGRVAPDPVPFDQAELSPMAAGFYQDCKRVRNTKIRDELGVVLQYPTWREGLVG